MGLYVSTYNWYNSGHNCMGKRHDKSAKWLNASEQIEHSGEHMIIFLGIWTDWNATPRWKNGTSISRCVVGTFQNQGRPTAIPICPETEGR